MENNMKTNQDYALMQKQYYEKEADNMNASGNHRRHDANPDYKNILLGRLSATPEIFKNEIALDFGCGQGRNVSNIISWFPNLFSVVEGVDISSNNIKYCEINLAREIGGDTKYKFHVNDGKSLENFSEF
jgi:2-polyprenyl-3-methyl-5-hydroxy-6-metoxy-1,4-benzoquinol methylase